MVTTFFNALTLSYEDSKNKSSHFLKTIGLIGNQDKSHTVLRKLT
jgi:hypothetical protein